MKSIIVVCLKCEMRVIPKVDGTCPSCRLDISRVEPIEINRQPEGSVRTKIVLNRPVCTPRAQVEEQLAWNETGVFERTLKRGQLKELFQSAQYNLIMRYVGMIWRRLFIGTWITSLKVAFFFPSILVSREFEAVEQFPVLVVAIFSGLYLTYEQIANRLQEPSAPSRRRKTLFEYTRQQIWIVLPDILSGLFVGSVMYFMLMYVPASLLHTIAPKESVQFDVVAISTGRSTKEFRKSCQYYVQFDVPKISSERQSVCLDKNQWLRLRNAGYPTTIHLKGKSRILAMN
jgi:hypothetical protein